MRRIPMVALVAFLAASSISAEDRSNTVRMTASGTMTATTINLGDHTITDGEDLAGDGTLGALTFHGLRADAQTPGAPQASRHMRDAAVFPGCQRGERFSL
jgi:hypothetical protein